MVFALRARLCPGFQWKVLGWDPNTINKLVVFFFLPLYDYYYYFLNGRGGSSSSNITVGERLLSTLLTEMDGLEEAKVSIHSQ